MKSFEERQKKKWFPVKVLVSLAHRGILRTSFSSSRLHLWIQWYAILCFEDVESGAFVEKYMDISVRW